MKKWFLYFLAAALIGACSLSTYAAHDRYKQERREYGEFRKGPDKDYKEPNHKLQTDSRLVIQRTAAVLVEAQRAAGRRHNKSGLAQAIAHQQMARNLYLHGSYQEAIFHSLRAREIALQILRHNRGVIRPEYSRDQMEDDYYHKAPPARDLDRTIIKIESDDDALHFKIDINI